MGSLFDFHLLNPAVHRSKLEVRSMAEFDRNLNYMMTLVGPALAPAPALYSFLVPDSQHQ